MNTSEKQVAESIRSAAARDDIVEASRLASDAVMTYSRSATLAAWNAAMKRLTGDLEGARLEGARALDLDECNADVQASQADYAMFFADFDAAQEHIDKAMKGGGSWMSLVRAMDLALLKGDVTHCKAYAKQIAKDYESEPLGFRYLADICARNGDQAELAVAERVLVERFPEETGTLRYLARKAGARQQLGQAVSLLKSAVERCPGSDGLWADLSMYQSFLPDFEAAKESANRALAINSRHPSAFSTLARVAEAEGKGDEAKRLSRLADDAVPVLSVMAKVKAATDLFKRDKVTEALNALDAIDTPNAIILDLRQNLKLRFLLRAKRYDEAETILQELWNGGKRTVGMFEAEGELRASRKNWAAAASLYEEGLVKFPNTSTLVAGLIRSYHKVGDSAKLDGLVQRILSNPPESAAGTAGVAMALSDAKRTSEADILMRNGVEKFPDSDTLAMAQAGLAVSQGDLSSAAAAAKRVRGPYAKRFRRFGIVVRTLAFFQRAFGRSGRK